MLIVGARMKARGDLATMIGWNAEAFARTKRIKPLDKYLEPPAPRAAERDQGALDVKRMLDRMILRQAQDERE